jgi:hypothetical protein
MKTIKSPLFVVISLVILMFIEGCSKSTSDSGSLYIPTTDNVTANATLQELQQGRVLYINNCGNCHGLVSPDNYAPPAWKSILNSMGPKTSMSSSEIILVTKYVSKGNQ